jgi:hypothetical protein
MLLTSSLVFSREEYLVFILKINSIAGWLICIFAYALLRTRKGRYRQESQLLLILDALMAFVAGILASIHVQALSFIVFSLTGFTGILFTRIHLLMKTHNFTLITDTLESALYVVLSATFLAVDRMVGTASYLAVGYFQIAIVCLFFIVNFATIVY